MKILFCTLDYYPGVTGGAERQARLQAEELVRRGHRVTVVCARTGTLRSGEIGGVRIVRLRRIERRRLFRISYFARLLYWLVCRGDAYDVIHVHLANLQADIAVLTARLRGAPCYVKVACGGAGGEIQRLNKTARLWRWYGLRNADRVQVLSSEIKAELAAIGVRHERMVEIPNGVDLRGFRPISAMAQRRVRNELALPEGAVITLFAGRLVDYKGIYDLLDAWPAVEVKNAWLVIVGATPEQQLHAAPRVIVRGWAESPLPYLHAADVFVQPSHADGMSNAVLEAMACGCALVATEHGATDGFLTAERDALLVAVRNPPELAAALKRLLADAGLRARLAANGRDTAERYAIGDVVDRIETEYRTMLADAGGPDPTAESRPGRRYRLFDRRRSRVPHRHDQRLVQAASPRWRSSSR